MTTSTRSRQIVFLGTHGQYNIGDELLLEVFLTQLGSHHRYVVNSYDPEFTRAQLGDRFTVDVIDTARDRRRLLTSLLRCDLLVFGGGSIIKELYASTGRNRYSTLLMILAIVTFTHRIARKPIAMLNIGVGPLRSPRGLRLARMILAQVDLLTVRDAKSRATCEDIGVGAVQATDAVFSADPELLLGGEASVEEQPSTDPGRARLRVALNLNYDIEEPESWESFLEQLALSLERLAADHPLELHALPMQTGFKEHDDASVLDAFAARVPSIPFVRHELTSPADAARLIAGCDVVVAERLHAIVMASVLGVPSFVLAYDVKVRELARMLGVEEWTVDIDAHFSATEVAPRLGRLVEQRGAVSDHVRDRSTQLRAEAQANFEDARRWTQA